MKVKITKVDYFVDWDYVESVTIETENTVLDFSEGDIEDNTLSRNFSDVYQIEQLIREAYEAGKNGEDLNIEEIKIDSKEMAEELDIF